MTDEVAWARSVIEPARGHAVDPETPGFALCAAILVGGVDGEFPKCSECVALLDG